jgi:tetratricopeptide (TPR) repeat protein
VRLLPLAAFLLALPVLVPAARAADTVAVIPLFNLDESSAQNLDWIGESVSETIRESLSSIGLLVLSREDREEVYHRLSLREGVVLTKASVLKIGEALDAGQIIFGEFRVENSSGDSGPDAAQKSTLRLVAHSIDLKKFHEGPEISQSGSLNDLSQMETRLAWMLARNLAPSLVPSEDEFFRARPPVKVEAMESYIRGLMAATPDQKMKLFSQAVRIDDHFSQPNFQLGRMLFQKKDYKNATQSFIKVSKSDSHFLEAAFLRGLCRYYDADYSAAIDQFKMVAAEIPLNEVYNDLGAALSRKNDLAGAVESFGKALEGDDGDPDYWFNVGWELWRQGKFELAAANFRALLDRSPGDQEATIMLGRCIRQDTPRPGDPRSEGRERIKITFEDSAWRQLQAELHSK